MGGDPVTSKPVPARGVASARGDRRGRFGGDILCNCSYSSASRGCDGGGVFGGVPGQLTIVSRVRVCVPLSSAVQIPVFCLVSGAFLSSLIDEMEGKEHEREEN